MNKNRIDDAISTVVRCYPSQLKPLLRANYGRIHWQVREVIKYIPSGGTILDLGSGVVPFMPTLQVLGYRAIMADDFGDSFYADKEIAGILDGLESLGVRIVQDNIFADTFSDQFDRLDLVASHDSMEHWHNSPKELFHSLWSKLLPGGLLWVGVPNCVNLRKRLTTPLGRSKWSSIQDWYETPVFRGHVREPDVGDLHYIGRDLGASRMRISGRNWIGYRHANPVIRGVTPLIDPLLRMRPSLCSDIYLYAWK